MLRIAFSTLAARKGGMIGALAAVGLAVILVVSCGILLESSMRAPIPVERLEATGVVVEAAPAAAGEGNVDVSLPERATLPASLVTRLQGVPGVRAAIADRSFPLQLIDSSGKLLTGSGDTPPVGHGWESAALAPIVLTRGRAPRGAREAVLISDLAERGGIELGDRVWIVTPTRRERFRVVGTAASPSGQSFTREAAVYFARGVAARLSGTVSRADLIGLLLEPGADRDAIVSAARHASEPLDAQVVTGAARGDAESPDSALGRADVVAGLTLFGFLAAFVAVFVVASTFALSVQQRHRELALFRAIGSTPKQVRCMVAAEALLVSLAAFALAAPLGVFAAQVEQRQFVRADMLPEGVELVVGPLPFVVGLVVAVVTTQLAAFASARRASRIRPTEALREASVRRRPISWLRGLVGLAAVAGGFAVVTTSGGGADSAAPAAALVWMVAVALLGPLLAWPFAWLLGLALTAVSRGPGLLAGANARANLRRVASVATPLMLVVSLVGTIWFGKTILRQQTIMQTDLRTTADYVLREETGSHGLPRDTAAAVRRVPGVAAASGSFATSVIVAADGTNLRSIPARAVDPTTLAGVLDLGIDSGTLANLHGDALAVGTTTARQFGWHTGDRVRLRLADGTSLRLRVAATFARPLGFGEVILPRALVERHVQNAFDDDVFVSSDARANRAAVVAALDSFAGSHPGLEVTTRAQYERSLEAEAQRQSLGVYVLLGLIVVFCALAVVNAVTMATTERGREFATLRLIGASSGQVRAMIRGETLITVAFGLVMGTLIVIPGLVVLNQGLTGSLVPSVPVGLYAVLVGGYAAITFAATVFPTRLALRANPVVTR